MASWGPPSYHRTLVGSTAGCPCVCDGTSTGVIKVTWRDAQICVFPRLRRKNIATRTPSSTTESHQRETSGRPVGPSSRTANMGRTRIEGSRC
ncbi:hypothetical protein BHE74_00047269 [Ensete ventricosum]|nr:hypothetical protein BHE74_00047269 [Ensete ventricosum]RZS27835.1 hypothetical protein BHM03_00061366 [Ensete ventricosum]